MSSTFKTKEESNGKLSFRVLRALDFAFRACGEQFPFARSLCILHHPWDALHTLVFVVQPIHLVLAFCYFPAARKEIYRLS